MSEISKYSDIGAPFVLVLPEEHTLSKEYTTLCNNVNKELEKGGVQQPMTYYSTSERLVIIEHDGKKKKINPFALRSLCRCAACIDELTGALLVKK